jgi:AraC-like DNA-binding protein
MKYAGELINDKTLLIKQIGVMCGYTDYYHFFKVFKNYYGVSPKEMRNPGEQEDL